MKKLGCLVIALLVAFLFGCQVPTDKTTENENGVNSPDIDKEVMSLNDAIDEKENGERNEEGAAGESGKESSKSPEAWKESVLSTVEPSVENGESKEKSKEKTKIAVTVYYRDSDNCLIPITRDIYKEEGIAKAALRCMVDNDSNRSAVQSLGLYPVLPEGTEILGMNIKDGIATVDFNSRILDYKDKTAENNIVAGVVYCLTEFSTIDGVKILVEGMEKEKLQYGGKHGMPGFAPTQGHIPSGVPIMGYAREKILEGKLSRVMVIGKGSLFLSRMTNQFDGVSFLIENNKGKEEEKLAEVKAGEEEQLRKLLADVLRDVANRLRNGEV